ncbi:MAG: hypothetical protein FJX57_08210 [Alphaproteobacteria bacterium]|nr:hypothetical protein [Alphaproteobacteria bacterium]
MTSIRRAATAACLLLLSTCASPAPEGQPTTARAAQAKFDALCATRPSRAEMEAALRALSADDTIETVAQRDFVRAIPWHLRPPPPGAASALRAGGKRWAGSGVPLFGGSFVAAAVYLDGEDRVRSCRSSLLHDGP